MNSLDKFIVDKSEHYPLSGEDLRILTKEQCEIRRYKDAVKMSLDDMLGQNRAVIILIEFDDSDIGHWVTLFETDDNKLEYFNSLGFGLKEKNLIELNNILINHEIVYNKTRLQSNHRDINTCGRYAGLRIVLRHLSLNDFITLLKKNKHYDPDFWVSILTIDFI